MSQRERINQLIKQYLDEVPPGGTNNQVIASQDNSAGNGMPADSYKSKIAVSVVKPEPKRGRGRPPKEKKPRKQSDWTVFMKEYIESQKVDGKLRRQFGEVVKEAGIEYRKLQSKGKGVASAPRDPELCRQPYIAPRETLMAEYAQDIDRQAQATVAPEFKKIEKLQSPNLVDLDGGLSIKEVKEAVTGRVKGLAQAFKGIRMNFPPSARRILEKYGDVPFDQVKVCRKPLEEKLQQAIRFSAKAGRIPYDKFFHLSIRFRLTSGPMQGQWLRIDKRESLHAVIDDEQTDTECMSVDYIGSGSGKTVNEVLAKTEKAVGSERFFRYRSDILEANDMDTPELKDFVLQDVSELFSEGAKWFADLGTDLKNKLGLLVEGFGKCPPIRGTQGGAKPKQKRSAPKKSMSKKVIKTTDPDNQVVAAPDTGLGIYYADAPKDVKEGIRDAYEMQADPGKAPEDYEDLWDSDSSDDMTEISLKIKKPKGGKAYVRPKSKGPAKPRKPSTWSIALRLWNQDRPSKWHIPRKGTPEHDEVTQIKKALDEELRKM